MTNIYQKYCCEKMSYLANVSFESEYELIRYHPHVRESRFILHGSSNGMELELLYCPWCGTKLPKSLDEEWCKIVKEKFDLDEVFAEEWATLPNEFKTDEWWKKRGL